MRVSIEIDDRLLSQALEVSELPTMQAVVEEALQLLICMSATREQASVRELFGKIPLDIDLQQSRRGRWA